MFKTIQYFFTALGVFVLLFACTGPWMETSVLEVGDLALSRPFETSFNADFESSFGSTSGKTVFFANEIQVAEKVLDLLTQELALRQTPGRKELLWQAAHYVGAKVMPEGNFAQTKDGKFHFYEREALVKNSVPIQPPKEKEMMGLLRQLPNEFRFYFRSLYSDRADAAKLCEAILDLPAAERKNLTVLAAYRLARLNLLQAKWDLPETAEIKNQISEIRHGFKEVKRLVDEGNPDWGNFALAAEGWLAHTYCLMLEPEQLQELGEADFGRAAETYLKFYKLGEGTAKDSLRILGEHLAHPVFNEKTVKHVTLRRLITITLSSGNGNWQKDVNSKALKGDTAIKAWFLALAHEPKTDAFDFVRVAMLQYRYGFWEDCAATLKSCPPSDPMVQLLQARLWLREGKVEQAKGLLQGALQSTEKTVVKQYHYHAIRDDDNDEFIAPYFFDALLTQETLLPKTRAEYADILLSGKQYAEAMNLFLRTGLQRDAFYIGECVLSVEELKAIVDRDWPELVETKVKPKAGVLEDCIEWEPTKEVRSLLARRLFRSGRWQESRPYFVAELRPEVDQYSALMQRVQDKKQSDRQRADAYWRASLIIHREGENLLFCNFGPSWSSQSFSAVEEDHTQTLWYDTPGLPRVRIQPIEEEPESLIAPPSPDEVKRVQDWMTANLDQPNRGHRDARYEVARLAVEAAKLLPDQDEAGSKILQFAGNLIKYREPKAAQPIYRLLATKYKKTELGERARKAHWFAPIAFDPNPDWIQKGP
jgi:hypothetical protein